jgi:putative ABC transport system ATP-binding protein
MILKPFIISILYYTAACGNTGKGSYWIVSIMGYIEFRGVCKYYNTGDSRVSAADHISFEIEKNEFCVIAGPSGAGKTTLLNMLGGMDSCDEGDIILDGRNISALDERQLTDYRRYDVGFVFQFYNLVQNLTALENVELASEICAASQDPRETLASVGLADRMDNFPGQLSGGEQQRVALARALAKNPKILLCDEPTGALDYETGKTVLRLLSDSCRITGKTVIVITHNLAIADMADRVIHLKNGAIGGIHHNGSPLPVEQIEW